MQHIATTQNMGLLVFLSLLLIVGGGGGRGRKHVSFADAAKTTPKTETLITYWAAVIPGVPVPPAIIDLLAQQNGLGSVDSVTMSPNNNKFVKGMRKIGPKYQKAAKSESDHGDKHVHIASKDEDDLKEKSMLYGSHAHRPEIEGKLKEISVSYGSAEGKDGHNEVLNQGEEDPNKATLSYGSEEEEYPDKATLSYGSEQEDDIHKATMAYRSEEEDPNKVTMSYGSEHEDDPHKATMSYRSEEEEDPNKATMSYRSEEEEDVNKLTMSYGSEQEEDTHKVTMSYQLEEEEDPNKATMSYISEEEEDPNKVTMSYRSEEEEDPNKATMSYRSEEEEDPNKATMSYRSEEEEDPNKATMSYRSEEEEDPNKVTMSYGSKEEEDPNKATMSYRSEEEEDPNKVTMSYGSEHEDDPHKATMSYGSQHEDDEKTLSTGHEAHIADMGSHHHHAHAHSHSSNKRQQADVFFFHDMLRPGSIITPSIRPTTSLPRLLPRRVADSIPFSTGRLSDIVAMFMPTTLRMTREIRWTLDTCEHPRTLPGQNAGCATSLESLSELPASLLGTHNVRAFSAANLPVEAPGTRALRGRYNVTAVRKVSGESSAIVTCHDLTYPYAVYYCHTANPTAAYSVTLASVEDSAGTPATMEALAVCHLDTSKWSPKHPFFELHNLKPGEVTVCHFLTKLSIIWVPGGEQGEARYK